MQEEIGTGQQAPSGQQLRPTLVGPLQQLGRRKLMLALHLKWRQHSQPIQHGLHRDLAPRKLLTPAGGFLSFARAPVKTKNRFDALTDRCILDSDGVQISRNKIVELDLLLKPKKPNKKRRGRRALSCGNKSASSASGNIYSATCQIEKSSLDIFPSTAISTSPLAPSSSGFLECRPTSPVLSDGLCCSTRCCTSSADFIGQGYEHPGLGHPHTHSTYCSQTIEPRSGIYCCSDICQTHHSGISSSCIDHTFINVIDTRDTQILPIAETQLILNGL